METGPHQSVSLPSVRNAFQITRMTEGGLRSARTLGSRFNSFLSKHGASRIECATVCIYTPSRDDSKDTSVAKSVYYFNYDCND